MKKKIVFIGNSIVNGFPFSRGSSFPGLIRAAIKASTAGSNEEASSSAHTPVSAKATIAADVINKGENGQTTRGILQRFAHDVLDHHPAAVFIMTGTNDFIYKESTPEIAFGNLEKMAGLAEDAGIVPVYMTPLEVDADLAGMMWMAGLGIDYEDVNRQTGELAKLIRGSGRLYVDTCIAYQQYALSRSTACEANGADNRPTTFEEQGSDNRPTACEGHDSDSTSSTSENRISTPGGSGIANAASTDLTAGSKSQVGSAAYHDGVHPTREGYAHLSEIVLKWIEENRSKLGL